ncbi:mitochondrial PGP phosphatase-domain-containing protein [Pyronema omphalodes]|nr:mitochondrial PGP phosphatase-domain-containing protein [Pyronema omphalodes]
MPLNLTATFTLLRALKNPSILVPHLTIPTFNQLPIPLFPGEDVRAVVLDKDNCFAAPRTDVIWPEYEETYTKLRTHYGDRLLIVSNTSGTRISDATDHKAQTLSQNTSTAVLRHDTLKPGCSEEIFTYLKARGVTKPSQIVVVGDRVATDVVMASLMGARSVWIRDGTPAKPAERTWYGPVEAGVVRLLERRGWGPVPVEEREI